MNWRVNKMIAYSFEDIKNELIVELYYSLGPYRMTWIQFESNVLPIIEKGFYNISFVKLGKKIYKDSLSKEGYKHYLKKSISYYKKNHKIFKTISN